MKHLLYLLICLSTFSSCEETSDPIEKPNKDNEEQNDNNGNDNEDNGNNGENNDNEDNSNTGNGTYRLVATKMTDNISAINKNTKYHYNAEGVIDSITSETKIFDEILKGVTKFTWQNNNLTQISADDKHEGKSSVRIFYNNKNTLDSLCYKIYWGEKIHRIDWYYPLKRAENSNIEKWSLHRSYPETENYSITLTIKFDQYSRMTELKSEDTKKIYSFVRTFKYKEPYTLISPIIDNTNIRAWLTSVHMGNLVCVDEIIEDKNVTDLETDTQTVKYEGNDANLPKKMTRYMSDSNVKWSKELTFEEK